MFAFPLPQKAKLLAYRTLSRKNRPADERPGVKLTFEVQMPNEMLDMFDPSIRQLAYEAAKGAKPTQGSLDGIPAVSTTPHLTAAGERLGGFTWHYDYTGYAITMIRGIGNERSNLPMSDCVVRFPTNTFKEGGTTVSKMVVEAGNVDPTFWQHFAELTSRECEVLAEPPEVDDSQRDIEDGDRSDEGSASKPVEPRKPGAAEKAAVAKVKGGKGTPVPHKEPSKKKARADAEAAFKPAKPAPVVTTKPVRTARGAAATKAFLEAQEREHGAEAAAGDEQP
jgi:hypothetical protein